MNREQLIEVFKDTENLYTNNKEISEALNNSKLHTFIYDNIEIIESDGVYKEPAEVKVTNLDTLTAAKQYATVEPEDGTSGIIGVLNFASATNPGGGVTKGSSAQEECLCRCTTLYPTLNQEKCWNKYYNVNRQANTNIGSDTIIYTRDVLVLKDKDYKLLDQMFNVDVLTCAAPNLRENPKNSYNSGANKEQLVLTDEELYDVHVKRAKCILEVATEEGVDYLILGAFGCGAFKNNPEVVAKAYRDTLPKYIHNFKVIDFAVIDGKYTNNYEIFKKILLS